MQLLLVRHGQTDWNIERRIMGASPVPLNELGERQAALLRDALQGYAIHHIYTSPIHRALQTAQILNQAFQIPLLPHDELAEVGYGTYVGKTFAEIKKSPDYQAYFLSPQLPVAPEGESLQQVQDRMWQFWLNMKTQHPSDNLLVVSHSDTIKSLLIKILGIDFSKMVQMRIDHATVSLLEAEKGNDRVLAVNMGPHFGQLLQR